MQGDASVIQHLNGVLKHLLTQINQTFLHARMLKNWGFDGIGDKAYKQSIVAMKAADCLIKRVLFLEGLPNLQDLGRLRIGEKPIETLAADLAQAGDIRADLLAAIAVCEKTQDFQSREHLDEILEDLEEYIDWLETQQSLLEDIGPQRYLQSQIDND